MAQLQRRTRDGGGLLRRPQRYTAVVHGLLRRSQGSDSIFRRLVGVGLGLIGGVGLAGRRPGGLRGLHSGIRRGQGCLRRIDACLRIRQGGTVCGQLSLGSRQRISTRGQLGLRSRHGLRDHRVRRCNRRRHGLSPDGIGVIRDPQRLAQHRCHIVRQISARLRDHHGIPQGVQGVLGGRVQILRSIGVAGGHGRLCRHNGPDHLGHRLSARQRIRRAALSQRCFAGRDLRAQRAVQRRLRVVHGGVGRLQGVAGGHHLGARSRQALAGCCQLRRGIVQRVDRSGHLRFRLVQLGHALAAQAHRRQRCAAQHGRLRRVAHPEEEQHRQHADQHAGRPAEPMIQLPPADLVIGRSPSQIRLLIVHRHVFPSILRQPASGRRSICTGVLTKERASARVPHERTHVVSPAPEARQRR